MAAIQEGKVNILLFSFEFSTSNNFLRLKFILSPSCDLRYLTEDAEYFPQ